MGLSGTIEAKTSDGLWQRPGSLTTLFYVGRFG